MKKCPYCGGEYADDVERCLIDNELLSGGEAPPLGSGATITATTPPLPISENTTMILSLARGMTDRQLRFIEMVLVCAIAFGTSILASSHSLFYGSAGRGSSGSYYTWIYTSAHEIFALVLLWYVLLRRGKTIRDLGLNWRLGDVWHSLVLYIGGSFVFYGVYDVIFWSGLTSTDSHSAADHVGHILFAGGISIVTIVFQFINPFFEELIVRAYVMTEIRQLTNSVAKAVIISTLLQTSYHFYQGVPAAFAHGAAFLIFSIYYAKTGRIAPIILAHLYSDVWGTLSYMGWH
jgi:membrane protease YdiL (CAAX protease family)